MAQRFLVTGAAGFIGSHLCRRLVADGHDVIGLDDLSDGSVDNLKDVPQVDLVQADLCQAKSVADAAKGCEVVFHQGAKRSAPRSMEEPELTTDVNVRGTLNVLLAARDQDALVVNASSSSVYGDQTETPHREDMEPRPRSPYAASKLAAEVFCATAFRAYAVPTVSLRYFNVYGPGQDPASEYAAVVPRFILACLNGRPPTVHGDGEQARDFTYIDDVIDANLLAARASDRAYGRAYNIGGGQEPTSINRLLELIASSTGGHLEPLRGPDRPGDVRWTHADLSRARAELSYEPRVGIQEGLRQTVDHFRGQA